MKNPGRNQGGSSQGGRKSTLRAKSGQCGSMKATRAQRARECECGDSCQEERINKASAGLIRFDSDFETILLVMCCSFLPLLFF